MTSKEKRNRTAEFSRNTLETQIQLRLNLDGDGVFEGGTGLAFLDHMMTLFARHGGLGIQLRTSGDLNVECHHMVEDLGIALGSALREAAGDKRGIRRFGNAQIPMEEALVQVTLDFCGRPYLHWEMPGFERAMIGDYATEMTEDFFRALAMNGGLTVHFDCPRGRNSHHIIEAAFKAFAVALRQALGPDDRSTNAVPSTKGVL